MVGEGPSDEKGKVGERPKLHQHMYLLSFGVSDMDTDMDTDAELDSKMDMSMHKEEEEEETYYQPGDPIDIKGLLFSPQRDFLTRNGHPKVKVDDLTGKTIVLFLLPLLETSFNGAQSFLDMIEAYDELHHKDVMFVFVAVPIQSQPETEKEKICFTHFFSTLPFYTIPYECEADRARVSDAFRLNPHVPCWFIIDQHHKFVAVRHHYPYLFTVYSGAELYPFTQERLNTLRMDSMNPRKLLQNLPELLEGSGDKNLISHKVIGLYFCIDHTPDPTLMSLIKRVYDAAKVDGYDFEIVQTSFFLCPAAKIFGAPPLVQPSNQTVKWLTLSPKDPRRRKLLLIFTGIYDMFDHRFSNDFLVIVDQHNEEVLFEFSGAEILGHYGIEGYPFTRQALYEKEHDIQKESAKVELLFPPGKCSLTRGAGDVVDASVLSGKQALLLFARHRGYKFVEQADKLRCKYNCDSFEIVYVSSDFKETEFNERVKDMPWLVHPYSESFAEQLRDKLFKVDEVIQIAAFDVNGELIPKKGTGLSLVEKEDKDRKFPFISLDLKKQIAHEVDAMCRLDECFNQRTPSESSDATIF